MLTIHKLKELELNAGKLTDLKLPKKIQKITFENIEIKVNEEPHRRS